MTDDQTTDENPETPDEDTPEAPEAAEEHDHDGSDDDGNPNAEAARYRRRLREAEAERDRLAGIVEAHQRAEVERLVADTLAVPGDLWNFGAELGAFVTDDGSIDAEAVATYVDTLAAERPYLTNRPRPPKPDPNQGRIENGTPSITWADAIGGR